MVNYNYPIQRVVAWYKLLRSLNNQHDGTPKISMKVFSNMVNTVLAKPHILPMKYKRFSKLTLESIILISSIKFIYLKSKNSVTFSKEIVLGIRKSMLRSEFFNIFKGNIDDVGYCLVSWIYTINLIGSEKWQSHGCKLKRKNCSSRSR